MILNRLIIGVLFKKRIFRLPSVGGSAIDELLEFVENNNTFEIDYFNRVQNPVVNRNLNDCSISLLKDNKENALHIQPQDFIFRKTSLNPSVPVNFNAAIEEFDLLWNCADEIIDFPYMRRLGVIGEFLIDVEEGSKATLTALNKTTNFTAESSSKFHLTFENMELLPNGEDPNIETDEFWNVITQLYNSELDESKVDNKIRLSLDVQRYYNPAKSNPRNELRHFTSRFQKEKRSMKDKLAEMDLI